MELLRMTPGPTYVTEAVRMAMAKPLMNPDLEDNFFELYREIQEKLKVLFETRDEVLILNGEGIMGLEAACASLIEPGDKILCIDNGIFGHGFIDFVKLYGGEAVVFSSDYEKPVDVETLDSFLKGQEGIKAATLVHCETPSGLLNDVEKICPLLKKYGILSIVDSVSALAGEPLKMDEWQMDVVLGATQKCISAPPGLTLVGVSRMAREAMERRKEPIRSFYLNLLIFNEFYEKKWFPYSQPVSDLYALNEALNALQEKGDHFLRHRVLGEAVRASLQASGLALFAREGFSNTVTTVRLPEGITFQSLQKEMVESHRILIGGAFDFLHNQVFRIGHMGENAREEKLYLTLKALDASLRTLGFHPEKNIHKEFLKML